MGDPIGISLEKDDDLYLLGGDEVWVAGSGFCRFEIMLVMCPLYRASAIACYVRASHYNLVLMCRITMIDERFRGESEHLMRDGRCPLDAELLLMMMMIRDWVCLRFALSCALFWMSGHGR